MEIIDKCCYFCLRRVALKVKIIISHLSGWICLHVCLKSSVHFVSSERLTRVYKGTLIWSGVIWGLYSSCNVANRNWLLCNSDISELCNSMRVYVSLLCIPISFFIWSTFGQAKDTLFLWEWKRLWLIQITHIFWFGDIWAAPYITAQN